MDGSHAEIFATPISLDSQHLLAVKDNSTFNPTVSVFIVVYIV